MPPATHGHVYIIHFFDLIFHKLVLVGFRALLIGGFYDEAGQGWRRVPEVQLMQEKSEKYL